jgi:hypothetical protein
VALKKRGKTWHTHFFVDGERFRFSLDTSDWREAQRKERVLRRKRENSLPLKTTSPGFPSPMRRNVSSRIGFRTLLLAAFKRSGSV